MFLSVGFCLSVNSILYFPSFWFAYCLRSASSTDYSLPRLHTKFGERAFSHAGPAAWNALPEDIRANRDRAVFRKQLKTHFFTLAFNVR